MLKKPKQTQVKFNQFRFPIVKKVRLSVHGAMCNVLMPSRTKKFHKRSELKFDLSQKQAQQFVFDFHISVYTTAAPPIEFVKTNLKILQYF